MLINVSFEVDERIEKAWQKACDAWCDEMDIEAIKAHAVFENDDDIIELCELALAGDKHAEEEIRNEWMRMLNERAILEHAITLGGDFPRKDGL